ncbi:hypothetical protein [Bacillus rhizoplanae]|uniref:hypothetical protein n=1 Tax=Bacillus rhizoplanae TaxID=2880966 RepID=UPI003D25B5C4
MARTFRMYLPQQRSGWKWFNWGIQVGQFLAPPVVHISACEARIDPMSLFGDLSSIIPVTGNAGVYVANVVPSVNPGGTLHVDFFLVVFSENQINVCCDITVFDPPEGGVIAK